MEISNKTLNKVLRESINKIIKESNNSGNYTHYAINKKTNLIVNGWDYSEYDNSELRAFMNDYFWDDMRDYGFNPKEYKIVSKQSCIKHGINPDDDCNWSNDGEIPCKGSCSMNEAWDSDYNAAMDKRDYEKDLELYNSKKWYQKIAALLSGKKPKDSNPDSTLKELLDNYVKAFNKEHGIGRRINYGNGDSYHSAMKYNSDTKEPVLSGTYYDGDNGVAYQSRKGFKSDGSKEEWGVSYPTSEFGITQDTAPDNASDDIKRHYNRFKSHQDEISNVIKNRNKNKGGN